MSKGIRNITNHHALTKKLADIFADQKVAHDRLGRNQEFVGQDVPWTNQDALFLDVLLQARQVSHTHLQIVLEHDRLPIQHEMLVIRVLIQDDKEIIHQMDELQAELLKGLIPFAIPMRV